MVEWVGETEAQQLKLDIKPKRNQNSTEACLFCSKKFKAHHSMTAHLRLHRHEIDNRVFDLINRSSKPIQFSTIQNLSKVNFSIRHSLDRLLGDGKIIYLRNKGYSVAPFVISSDDNFSRLSDISQEQVKSPEPPVAVTQYSEQKIPENQMNKLIVATLRRSHPDVLESVVNEIIEKMVQYTLKTIENE